MRYEFSIFEEGNKNNIVCRVITNNGKNALRYLSKNLMSTRMERIYKDGKTWKMDTTIGRYYVAYKGRKV